VSRFVGVAGTVFLLVFMLLAGVQQSGISLDPRGLHMLKELGQQYPMEVAGCFYADGFEVPHTFDTSRTGVHSQYCRDDAVALAHTHPRAVLRNPSWQVWFLRQTGRTPTGPVDLCYLSGGDLATLVTRSDIPYGVVVVDRDTWCWWAPEQIEALVPGNAPYFPPDGQLISKEN